MVFAAPMGIFRWICLKTVDLKMIDLEMIEL